jgi:hypothetical protein
MVPDPTPSFTYFPVINPRFERDILVIDFQADDYNYRSSLLTYINISYPDLIDSGFMTRKDFWKHAIEQWDPSIDFNPYGEYNDYAHFSFYSGGLPLEKLLKYKVYILVEDHPVFPANGFNNTDLKYADIFTGIDVGINAWVAGRSVLYADKSADDAYNMVDASSIFRTYFGVDAVYYTQWLAFRKNIHPFYIDPEDPLDGVRMEDFVGAYSIDQAKWPELDLDDSLLHARYFWDRLDTVPVLTQWTPWRDTIASLPEVGWCERSYGTEVMYLYKSRFGANHFLGYPFNMEGTPVGHRYETNMFRTSWMMFTPYTFPDSVAYDLVGKQLDWLYDPNLGQSTTSLEKRYPSAAVKISLDEARVNSDLRRNTY